MATPESAASADLSPTAKDPPVPKILLRRPGTLELFRAPPRDVGEKQLRDLELEEGFPALDATVTEWSK